MLDEYGCREKKNEGQNRIRSPQDTYVPLFREHTRKYRRSSEMSSRVGASVNARKEGWLASWKAEGPGTCPSGSTNSYEDPSRAPGIFTSPSKDEHLCIAKQTLSRVSVWSIALKRSLSHSFIFDLLNKESEREVGKTYMFIFFSRASST